MAERDRLWRSLSATDEAAVLGEFPMLAHAARIDRRMAMKLLGASAALAAASGCRRDPGKAVSEAEEVNFGRKADPVHYATTLEQNGEGVPVVVETVNGWPIKIEGNPRWVDGGGSSAFTQAELLGYYDPDRPRKPLIGGRPSSWDVVETKLRSTSTARGSVHVLTPPSTSPLQGRILDEAAAALPGLRVHRWRPIANERPLTTADFEGTILSIGADFLGPGPDQVPNAAAWANARQSGRVGHLIVAESVPSLTGARADRRIAMPPQDVAELAREGAEGALGRRLGLPPVDRVMIGRQFQRHDFAEIAELTAALLAGEVGTLIILGGNPAYDAPADLAFPAAMRRAGRAIFLGAEMNETAALAHMFVPGLHRLERWDAFDTPRGARLFGQPAAPARERAMSEAELLALAAGLTRDLPLPGSERQIAAGGIEQTHAALRADVVADQPGIETELTLVFRPDASVWDGSYAPNAWLQELPDPITKLSWGNALTLAPATAARFGVENGDMVRVESLGRTLDAPVWLLPGQAENTASLALGYGRTLAGVGSGVGVNAYALRTSTHPWHAPCTLKPTGGHTRLVSTELHQPLDDASPARRMKRTTDEEPPDFYDQTSESGAHQWGMVIDLDTCIGCAACTVACQAENNIPVVGPEEVARGREMHWLRVDRYWRGSIDDCGIDFQPVPCMHCETAPCEPVCPVGATSHSSEGLNQMTYNRCIGTRTCSNNCPYKVRRFNWFDYAEEDLRPEEGTNPRVTIRERGVMEKCTYCVQRIEAFHTGDIEGPPRTACQQACPTQAITFGDLSDPGSEVSRKRASPRNYALLGGLNLGPRTTYLARLEDDDGDG